MMYTRKGDSGDTGLFGTTERLPKDHPVFEALGSVDELNSLIGFLKAYVHEEDRRVADELRHVQESLFFVQAELAGAEKYLSQASVDDLEVTIDAFEARITKPHSFVVPGASVESALCDYVRAVARRAERAVLRAQVETKLRPELLAYLNRLSSFFYALGRYAAQKEHVVEEPPSY